MTIGIILAAGKGTRLQSKTVNKTSLLFNGKPIITYGVHLFQETVDKTIVVVGAFARSVMQSVDPSAQVVFAHQHKRLGTGHALVVALRAIEKSGFFPERVVVGYGDHMMFYPKQMIKDLLELHEKEHAIVTLVSTDYDKPDFLGRIVRDNTGKVTGIVEHKDATEEQRKITEINPGFYCFDYNFLRQNYHKIRKSPVSGEYYINEFIRLATEQGKTIAALKVPFAYVGIGINTRDEFEQSQTLHKRVSGWKSDTALL